MLWIPPGRRAGRTGLVSMSGIHGPAAFLRLLEGQGREGRERWEIVWIEGCVPS